jgi:hypothetical protein
MRNKKALNGDLPESQIIKKKCSPTWAMLIRMIYEVNPLVCPECGEEMRIISFINKKQTDVIEKILKHCDLWKDKKPRPPPKEPVFEEEIMYDSKFFDNICA